MSVRRRNRLAVTYDGHRIQFWPVFLRWANPLTPNMPSRWFHRHLWQTGSEMTPDGSTAGGMMPGLRSVYGQTWHFGRLKLCLGKDLPSRGQTVGSP